MATVTKPLALNESLNSTENTPRNIADVLADELDGIKQAINSQSGSGNGHIIQNSSGANMPSENTMQFVDAHLSDDNVGGKTKVETFKAVTEAEYSSETEDGAYIITDGDGAVIEPASEDKIEVTADGDKTYGQLLGEIWTDLDIAKVTLDSKFTIGGVVYNVLSISSSSVIFSYSSGSKTSPYLMIAIARISSNPALFESNESTYHESINDKPTNGTKITLYYGQKKATVDLQTTANRCWLNNGKNVENSIGLKLASSWSQALNQATEYILFVGKGTDSNSTKVTSSIYIPIKALTSTKRYWMNTLYALNSFHIHLQVNISLTEATNIGLYQGTSVISDATYEIYYR